MPLGCDILVSWKFGNKFNDLLEDHPEEVAIVELDGSPSSRWVDGSEVDTGLRITFGVSCLGELSD